MQMLNNDWLTNDPIDFEYKKYLILAYEQHQSKFCDDGKLYPNFTDLIDKVKLVNEFIKGVNFIEQSKLEITEIQTKGFQYKSLLTHSHLDEVKQIAQYSKEIFADLYIKYRKLLDEVDESIVISGCRVELFNMYDGYIILKYEGKEKILEYEVVRLLYPKPHYILKTRKANLKDYYSNRLIKNVYDVIFTEHYPMKESILPVYQKKFLETVFGFY